MKTLLAFLLALTFAFPALAAEMKDEDSVNTFIEEIDPFDPQVEQVLKAYDAYYEMETGLSAHLEDNMIWNSDTTGCRQYTCAVWAEVIKSKQVLNLYVNGTHTATWKVSTGVAGRGTPNFDKNPDGRIYNRYTSTKFPGGDYNGLGNMPYAVFISGGFAIHGTPKGNWGRLGTPASHGCIRVHPDNGAYFNQLVRQAGVRNTWITVRN